MKKELIDFSLDLVISSLFKCFHAFLTKVSTNSLLLSVQGSDQKFFFITYDLATQDILIKKKRT